MRKSLWAKYRLQRNIYVHCRLDVLDANDHEFKAFVGAKHAADAALPLGTKLVLNVVPKRTEGEDGILAFEYEVFSVTVTSVEESDGRQLHICSPIVREVRPNLREAERVDTDFTVGVSGLQASFTAVNTTLNGLTLKNNVKKVILGLVMGRKYDFIITHHGVEYPFPGEIRHIQYDWAGYEHLLGMRFGNLNEEQTTILNLLMDPEFKIEINQKQTINPALGKIQAE